MISEEEAREKILATVSPLPARTTSLAQALNGFAAEDVLAKHPLPVFDNSAMDGYAVIAATGKRLRVIGEQPATVDRNLRIQPGEAVRIFTGAPIPAGADAVVMQEDVIWSGDEIEIKTDVTPGEFIRRRGCDLAVGQKILSRGQRIRPTTLALLASQGIARIEIGGMPNASALSTGDELVPVGVPLQPGQIYDSNSLLIDGLLRQGGAAVRSVEHCRDDRAALRSALSRAVESDVVVMTGGVSVGEHDLVQETLRDLGAEIGIWRVAIKPGKPFLFASLGQCRLFGLPGNPVSAYVTFHRFVRPALLKMSGADATQMVARRQRVTVAVDIRNEDVKRRNYIRGQCEGDTFRPVGRQESHALFGLAQASAILPLEPGTAVKAGTNVEIEFWD
jgi:molybdopterin molybdotransferase